MSIISTIKNAIGAHLPSGEKPVNGSEWGGNTWRDVSTPSSHEGETKLGPKVESFFKSLGGAFSKFGNAVLSCVKEEFSGDDHLTAVNNVAIAGAKMKTGEELADFLKMQSNGENASYDSSQAPLKKNAAYAPKND